MKKLILFISFSFISNSFSDEKIQYHEKIAKKYFQNDFKWYLQNIPFFECPDTKIERVYYYRWKLFKAHIRDVGENEHIITEFINHVPWDREPFCTINAASMHHIMEGRWLRNNRFLDGYINNLFRDGGNNRRYSESIAHAAYNRYLVNSDNSFIISHLDSMVASYHGWGDHLDASKNLYYIPAMPDATEYTIASIDATGGKDGFEGGEAFRPIINSYQYGNAWAISKIAKLKNDEKTSSYFLKEAINIKKNMLQNLWNSKFNHFLDRYQVDNQFVKNWDFIRGRELAGYVPWYFNLPDSSTKYHKTWTHMLDTTRFLGPFGFRTQEPSYEYYFKQYLWHEGKRGSQWNGPSWPYQTSQVLTGMANFLQNYSQNTITNSDYLMVLRLYTDQHFLPNGEINLVENYDPNLGGPIVHYNWSNHYLHSSYNNLIIAGLCGIEPSDGENLTINPLIDNTIEYFQLSNLAYHGHNLTVIYDKTGKKYNFGKGITVFKNGKKAIVSEQDGKYLVKIGTTILKKYGKESKNHALNIHVAEYPKPSASINNFPDSLNKAIDGRIWYFPEVTNRWSTVGSKSISDWYSIDFGEKRAISKLKIHLFSDNNIYKLPNDFSILYFNKNIWKSLKIIKKKLVENTENEILFDKISTSKIKINFVHQSHAIGLVEFQVY